MRHSHDGGKTWHDDDTDLDSILEDARAYVVTAWWNAEHANDHTEAEDLLRRIDKVRGVEHVPPNLAYQTP